MRRHELSDEQWHEVSAVIPAGRGRPSERGDRNFVDAVVWVAKTGAPWRDLPERFGSWKTVFNRFSQWSKRGGVSTKIHAVTDTQGRPIHVEITPGQQHDVTMAEQLLEYVHGQACIADTGYDSNKVIAAIKAKGLTPVIASNPSRNAPLPLDKELYALRYNVERFFHTLKRFRRIATRYEKTARNYLAFLHLAGALIWVY